MSNLHDLFVNELELMHSGEKQMIEAMPNVIAMVASNKLRQALHHHLEETKVQARRLETILRDLKVEPREVTSHVMESLIKEVDRVGSFDYEEYVKDAAIINALQHIEHFEIASYGILKSLAKSFEYKEFLTLLEKSSQEEGKANKKLNEIAEGGFMTQGINVTARKVA